MSSGEPTDVTISIRAPGAEMRLGRLVSGPTGQLVIDTQAVDTGQPNTTKPELTSSSEQQESILRLLRTLSSFRESSGK